MIVKIIRIILLLCLIYLPTQAVLTQTSYSSNDNYTGFWTTPETWDPVWADPMVVINGDAVPTITINGYITADGPLSFIGTATNLIINDTLVINGDLQLGNNNDLTINDNGILIIWGNLTFSNQTQIQSNGYLIVIGNVYKGGSIYHGSWSSNDTPVKVFIGGTIPASLSLPENSMTYPAVTCPSLNPYPNTGCSYGNMTDLASDPIYGFLYNSCSVLNTKDTITICEAETINLTSSPGTTYSWSGPNSFTSNLQNPSIPLASLAMAGNYKIVVTNAFCTDTDTTNVIVNALPGTPTITPGSPVTFCAGNNVTLTSSEASSYLWSTGATTQSINIATAGNFTVQVTDANGCLSAASEVTTVIVNALPVTPTITASGPTTFCSGGNVTLTSSAETGYLWSTGAATQSISVNAAGSYSVKTISSEGCMSAASVSYVVTVNTLPEATANNSGAVCQGSALNLTGGPEGMTSYLWTGPDGFMSLLQNPSVTANAALTRAGVYTLSVTDANGCSNTAVTTVVVNTLPVVSAGADITIPGGTSTTLDATVTGTGPFAYSWTPPGQLVNALIEDPVTVNLANTTVFTLTATSTATYCSAKDEVTVTVSGGPLSLAPAATPGIICSGESIKLRALASGGSGSYSYTWTSIPSGFSSSVADPVVSPVVNTIYSIAVFDGFSTVNSQVAVTVNELPGTPVITAGGPVTFCAGGNVTLTSNTGTSYLWSTGATTESINVLTSGSYTVKVTNASGCTSLSSAATEVTINALPIKPTIVADGPTAFCPGGDVTLTSSTEAGYLWSTGETTQSINVNAKGDYTVQVTNENGCTSGASVATTVTVYDSPITPTITSDGPATFCTGDSLTLTSSESPAYLWSTGAVTPSINVTESGSYSVKVTNSNGCQSTSSVPTVVTVNLYPAAPVITVDGPTTFCSGESVTLTSSEGISYLWSTGQTTPDINITSPGSYTVQVTGSGGCTSEASPPTDVTVHVLPAKPTITADGPTTFCEGSSVNLTSSSGENYLWSTSATTSSINAATDGHYNVQVIDLNGCRSPKSDPVQVKVNASPAATADSNSPVCVGGTITLSSSGGATYDWSGPNGFISGKQNPSITDVIMAMAGIYKVIVTSAEGCTNSDTVLVSVSENPIAMAGPDQDLKFVFKTEMRAELSSPETETGEWTLVSGSALISDIHSPVTPLTELAPGKNIFTWKVTSGACKASDEVIISVEDLFIPSVITPNGDGKNDFFIVNSLTMPGAEPAELIILNKWGSVEYRNKNYLNEWDGKNDRGNDLENDTYMYILRFENGYTRKGTVLITR